MTKHIAATFLQACDDLAAQCDALCHERGLMHRAHDAWPVAPDVDGMELGEPVGSTVRQGRVETLHTIGDGVLVSVTVADGGVTVRTHAASPVAAAEALAHVREVIPRGSNPNPNLVPVSFWTYSPHGPQRIRRDVDADAWPSITTNYTARTAEAVGRLVDPAFRPGVGGQLVLWHGDAGTGKTTALRALAREWREWCEMHYIVDPDQFFGKHADYMMRVLLGGDTDPMAELMRVRRGLMTTSQPPPWRLLILEDCGEMLQPDARRDIGQALSRFLNACDGLIGRGLRVLVLVTTNEPLDKLHDAVSRPGRCAARVQFERFGASEARDWLAERDGAKAVPGGGLTLAELFGMVEGFQDAGEQRRSIGFAS
jgi:hypothetical protein